MIPNSGPREAAVVRNVVLRAYERYVAVIATAPGPTLDERRGSDRGG
jgi:O-acetyl-ADP-ribose deacetylase (regulator of RNase III)